MRAHTRARTVLVLAAVAALTAAPVPAGAADTAAPAASRYAFPAAVRVATDPSRARLEFRGSSYGLPLGTVSVPVADQARAAWEAVGSRMFDASAGEPALVLEVALGGSDVRVAGGSGIAIVEHDVVARTSAGIEVGRWRVDGEAPIVGLEDASVVRAFSRAAAVAASAFEHRFDASPAVHGWLADRGFQRRIAPQPAPVAPLPARSGAVGFVDVGPGLDTKRRPGVSLRAGASGAWWSSALLLDWTSADFSANPAFGTAVANASFPRWSVGLDAALVQRWGRSVEGQVGVGAMIVGGTATLEYQLPDATRHEMTISDWAPAGSAFAAVRATTRPFGRLGVRWRTGLEARLNVGGSLSYGAWGSTVKMAPMSVAAFVGFELPASFRAP